jgi:hypothetical protein
MIETLYRIRLLFDGVARTARGHSDLAVRGSRLRTGRVQERDL